MSDIRLHISQTTCANFTKFLYLLVMPEARSSSGNIIIVDDVMFSYSTLFGTTRCWQSRCRCHAIASSDRKITGICLPGGGTLFDFCRHMQGQQIAQWE